VAGTKTTIIELVVSNSAREASSVSVQVKVKNTTISPLIVMVGGALEYGVSPWPTMTFTSGLEAIPAGETRTYYGSFTMPRATVVVHAYSYYYDGTLGAYVPDDEASHSVLVEAAPNMLEMMMPIMMLGIMVPVMMKMMPKD
jgi:hypothetical protein